MGGAASQLRRRLPWNVLRSSRTQSRDIRENQPSQSSNRDAYPSRAPTLLQHKYEAIPDKDRFQVVVDELPQVVDHEKQAVRTKMEWKKLMESRLWLLVGCGLAYSDSGFDGYIFVGFVHDDFLFFAGSLAASIIVPQVIAWLFLGGYTTVRWEALIRILILPCLSGLSLLTLPSQDCWVKDLVLFGMCFSLEHAWQVMHCWGTGAETPEVIWPALAEGLIEAPLSCFFSLYPLLLYSLLSGDDVQLAQPIVFSLLLSLLSISYNCAKLSTYGLALQLPEQITYAICFKLPVVVSQLLGHIIFAVLTRPMGDLPLSDEMRTNRNWFVLAIVALELLVNGCILRLIAPSMKPAVTVLFAIAMLTVGSPDFLDELQRAKRPHAVMRFGFQLLMAAIVVAFASPKHLQLLSQAPIRIALVLVLGSSFVAVVAAFCSDVALDLAHRSDRVDKRLIQAAKGKDRILCDMLIQIDGADVVQTILRCYQLECHFDCNVELHGAAIHEGRIYCPGHSPGDRIICHDLTTGNTTNIETGCEGRAWNGAVVSNGCVYFTPVCSKFILCYNPVSQQMTPIPTGGEEWDWHGIPATCKDCVYFAPFNSDDILCYDTAVKATSRIPCKARGGNKWDGAFTHGDCVYFAPCCSADILCYNTTTKETRLIPTHSALGGNKWRGGVACGESLYFTPRDSHHILLYTLATGQIDLIQHMGVAHIGDRWQGAFTWEGNVFFAPEKSEYILCYSPKTLQVRLISAGSSKRGRGGGVVAYERCFYMPFGREDGCLDMRCYDPEMELFFQDLGREAT